MVETNFLPTHTLAWHDAYIDVAITPSMRFEAQEGDGKGKILTPAYTCDEWSVLSTAQWTRDDQGRWYFFGEHVFPQPDVETFKDR
jgi:hypothetical protein